MDLTSLVCEGNEKQGGMESPWHVKGLGPHLAPRDALAWPTLACLAQGLGTVRKVLEGGRLGVPFLLLVGRLWSEGAVGATGDKHT